MMIPRPHLRKIIEEEFRSARREIDLRSLIREAALLEGKWTSVVEKIQAIVGAKVDGDWGQETDRKWYAHLAGANVSEDTHGAGGERLVKMLKNKSAKWPEVASTFRKALGDAGKKFTGDPNGSLVFLEWLDDPGFPVPLKPVGLLAKSKVRVGKEVGTAKLTSATGEEVEFDDWQRRRGKVHILVPSEAGDTIVVPGFRRAIVRIKIVLRESGSLGDDTLTVGNVKKLKINGRLLQVFDDSKFENLLDVLEQGKFTHEYSGDTDPDPDDVEEEDVEAETSGEAAEEERELPRRRRRRRR